MSLYALGFFPEGGGGRVVRVSEVEGSMFWFATGGLGFRLLGSIGLRLWFRKNYDSY